MKTHDFARSMQRFAKILLDTPNIDVGDVKFERPFVANSSVDVAVSLHAIAQLAKIDKNQWMALIEENNFNIKFRPRDASRDIIGKLLKYLSDHPEELDKLERSIKRKSSRGENELTKALDLLIPKRFENDKID